MSLPVLSSQSLYQQLMELPEHLTGEIIGGRLYTQPRPPGPHLVATATIGADIHSAYDRARGWWILNKPELHFERDTEVAVPDIAGWKRERLPQIPRDQRFEVAPEWICEVLSPGTAKHDRVIKMPLYAQYRVSFLWLVDPLARTLEAFVLKDGYWTVIGQFKDQEQVSVEPLSAISLSLADLWVEVEG